MIVVEFILKTGRKLRNSASNAGNLTFSTTSLHRYSHFHLCAEEREWNRL